MHSSVISIFGIPRDSTFLLEQIRVSFNLIYDHNCVNFHHTVVVPFGFLESPGQFLSIYSKFQFHVIWYLTISLVIFFTRWFNWGFLNAQGLYFLPVSCHLIVGYNFVNIGVVCFKQNFIMQFANSPKILYKGKGTSTLSIFIAQHCNWGFRKPHYLYFHFRANSSFK